MAQKEKGRNRQRRNRSRGSRARLLRAEAKADESQRRAAPTPISMNRGELAAAGADRRACGFRDRHRGCGAACLGGAQGAGRLLEGSSEPGPSESGPNLRHRRPWTCYSEVFSLACHSSGRTGNGCALWSRGARTHLSGSVTQRKTGAMRQRSAGFRVGTSGSEQSQSSNCALIAATGAGGMPFKLGLKFWVVSQGVV